MIKVEPPRSSSTHVASVAMATAGSCFAIIGVFLCNRLLNTPQQPPTVHDSALYAALAGIAASSLGVVVAVIGAAWGLRRHQQYAVFPAAISVVLFVIAVALFFLDWWRGLSFSFK